MSFLEYRKCKVSFLPFHCQFHPHQLGSVVMSTAVANSLLNLIQTSFRFMYPFVLRWNSETNHLHAENRLRKIWKWYLVHHGIMIGFQIGVGTFTILAGLILAEKTIPAVPLVFNIWVLVCNVMVVSISKTFYLFGEEFCHGFNQLLRIEEHLLRSK